MRMHLLIIEIHNHQKQVKQKEKWIKIGTFNKKKITKVINNDVALSESSFLQERVIDLFHDEIRLKNLQRKKQI